MSRPGPSLSINTNPASSKSRSSPVKPAPGLRLYDLPTALESPGVNPNPQRRARPGGLAALPSDPDSRSVYTSSDRHSQWTRASVNGARSINSPTREDGPTHEVKLGVSTRANGSPLPSLPTTAGSFTSPRHPHPPLQPSSRQPSHPCPAPIAPSTPNYKLRFALSPICITCASASPRFTP